MDNAFLTPVLRVCVGKTSTQRGFLSGQLVYLFVEASGGPVYASAALLSDAGTSRETSLCRRLHSLSCAEESDQVAIGALKFKTSARSPLPLPFHGEQREAGNAPRFLHQRLLPGKLSRNAFCERFGQSSAGSLRGPTHFCRG